MVVVVALLFSFFSIWAGIKAASAFRDENNPRKGWLLMAMWTFIFAGYVAWALETVKEYKR